MTQLPVTDDAARRAKNTRRVIGAIVVLILLALLLWFFLMRKPAVPPPLAEFGAPLVVTDMELCPGLQLITAISQPEGDYESIKTIEVVDSEGVHIRYSSEAPVGDVFADDYGKMRRMTVTRTVRMEDLQSAAFYAQRWFEGMPEVIPLSTALGVSGRILGELKSNGVSVIGVSNAYAGDPPVDRDERPNIYDYISGPLQTAFRGDNEPIIGMQGLMQQPFGRLRSVRVGGIDEVHAKLWQAMQRAQRFRSVGGFSPDAASSDAHRPKSQSVYGKFAADLELTGLVCICSAHGTNLFMRELHRWRGIRSRRRQ